MRYIRKHIIGYQLCILLMYLVWITITSSMKVTLPIYIVFSLLPFIHGMTKFEPVPFVIISISLLYIFYGLVFQDKTKTLVSFFSKTYQFIAFMLFMSFMRRFDIDKIKYETRLMWLCIVVETILGIYLLRHSSLVDKITGLPRITSGRQPVGGNFTIVMIPVIFYAYFRHKEIRRSVVSLSIIPAVWIFISGTRGYMLMFLLSLAPMYWDYFFSFNNKSRNKAIFACILNIVMIIVIAYVIFNKSELLNLISMLLRIEAGTGSREMENRIAIDFFKNTTILYKIFGIGYGGKSADVPGYLSAVSANATTTLSYSNYIERVGASFHNLLSNYLLLQGIVGCIEIIIIFLWGLSKLKRVYVVSKNEKRCIFLYWIAFFIMNCFRWSCDCGISEMIIFVIILGMMNKNNNYNHTINLTERRTGKLQDYKR